MASKVLVIEDDPHTTELVRLYLAHDGHQVVTAATGPDGLARARETAPDLIVLDLMLPGRDGLDICRELRAESDVPIIMLTARVEEEDLLAGLDRGADDYVTKPFRPRELAARVKTVLRRSGRESNGNGAELAFGEVHVNPLERRVAAAGREVSLTPTEYRILLMLLREPGRIFSREEIIDRVFGEDFDGFDRTVDTHIYSLRRKLEAPLGGARYIHTVYGMGYKLANS